MGQAKFSQNLRTLEAGKLQLVRIQNIRICSFAQFKLRYCKFRNFRENFIFANSVKRLICDVKNSRLGYDLPPLLNVRVISPFPEGIIFTKLIASAKFGEKRPSRKLLNLQYNFKNEHSSMQWKYRCTIPIFSRTS